LFEQYSILENIENNGFFEITADQIKEAGREPRLMTKFDSSENLPEIFSKNNLAILPIKRGSYIIGHFQNYQDIEIDNNIDVETKYLPDFITTIDYKNINSEAISLNSAYISGMLEDIVGEEIKPTIQGRMGTGEFNYKIDINSSNDSVKFNINVQNSQMEIDGSYEGISKFVILEAKNHYMKDFIIRQLYYPYKVWKSITSKEIVPIMLIKHDNIYNFFVYEFTDIDNYNSIKLKEIKRYILDEIYSPIEFSDVVEVMNKIDYVDENSKIPFPQANSFYRVLDLINELDKQEMTAIEISELYEFDPRQANYYLSAAEYLGLAEKNSAYMLTSLGKSLMTMNHKNKNLELIKLILSHKPFYYALEHYVKEFEFDSKGIANLIDECRSELNMTTAERRTSTVIAWIKWIIELTSTFNNTDFINNINLE
jgi:hypothetical protein